MWIEEIHIDRFGIFNDLHIKGLNQHLTLFYGDNEAGKSTMMSFVRQILFGFPDKRAANRKQYIPVDGGSAGGKLIIRMENNECYNLSRVKGPHGGDVSLIYPDGKRGGTQDWERIRGNASVDVYETIFAFSLDELQSFETLENEKVNEIIYSAGMGVNPKGIANLKKAFETGLSSLYKPQASNPLINRTLRHIKDNQKQIKESLYTIEEYQSKKIELEKKRDELAALKSNIEQLNRGKIESELQLAAYDTWTELKNKRKELADIPEIKDFPLYAVEKHKELKLNIDNEKKEIDILNQSLQKNREKLDQIDCNNRIIEIANDIELLSESRERYIDAKRDIFNVTDELKNEKSQLEKKLKSLGSEWDTAKLKSTTISLQIREEVSTFQSRLNKSRDKLNSAENEVNHYKKITGNFEAEAEKSEREMNAFSLPETENYDELNLRKKKLEDIEDDLHNLNINQEKLHGLINRKNDAEQTLEGYKSPHPIVQAGALMPGFVMAALLIVSGIILYIFLRVEEQLFVFGAVAFLTILVTYYIHKKQSVSPVGPAAQRQKRISVFKESITQFSIQIENLKKNIEENKEYNDRNAAEIGITPPLNEKSIRENIRKIEQDISNFLKWLEAKRTYDKAAADLKKAKKDLKTTQEAFSRCTEEFRKTEQGWKKWLIQTGFRENLLPENITNIFAEIEKAQNDLKTIFSLEERISKMQDTVKRFEDTLTSLMEKSGAEIHDSMKPEEAISHLKQQLDCEKDKRNKSEHLEEDIESQETDLTHRQSVIEQIEHDINNLYDKAGASNENEFFQTHQNWETKTNLDKEIKDLSIRLEQLAGHGKITWLEDTLPKIVPIELKTIHQNIEKELDVREKTYQELHDENVRLESDIEKIEESHNTSDLQLENQIKISELESFSRQWAVFAIAKDLLKQAREKYEKERQPDVLQAASRHFNAITNGVYKQVVLPPDAEAYYILDQNESRKTVGDMLSRGTAEELYFAIRLGLIIDFSKREEPLPVIMDDIFVNMDDNRAPAAISSLRSLLETNQVIVFTCHANIVDMFKKEFHDLKIRKLENGR